MRLQIQGIKLLGTLFKCFPIKKRVILMSRQSAHPSENFQMLHDELSNRLSPEQLQYCLCEPEFAGKGAFIKNTIEQMRIGLCSRVVVLDGYVPAMSVPSKRNGINIIQLWHASGAIKKFGFQCVGTPAGRTEEEARLGRMHANYDVIIASGPGPITAWEEAFGYGPETFKALGHPHFDYLLDPSSTSPRRQTMNHILKKNPWLKSDKRIILYAPTFRQRNSESRSTWVEDAIRALAHHCKDNELLVFSGHPYDKEVADGLLNEIACLRIIKDATTIDLMGFANCIISDYSDIALDAGFLGSNVCFYVPDIDDYSASPGLNVDLLNKNICFASRNSKEVMNCAHHDSCKSFDAWRKFCTDHFKGIDYGCTKRIANLIINYLG